MYQRSVWSGVLVTLLLAVSARGEIMVTIGDHELMADTAGQQVKIFVTGGDLVGGVNLRLQISDGVSGPVITDVDLVTGTIFAASNPFTFEVPVSPRLVEAGAAAGLSVSGVAAEGLLATLTVSTVGVMSGEFVVMLSPPALGPTEFLSVGIIPKPLQAVQLDLDGKIEIIAPEPTGLWALSALGCGALLYRRNRA